MPRVLPPFSVFKNKIMRSRNQRAFVCGLAILLGARAASAQSLADIGPRAPAMAAFVAVADDGSAVLWNPSGLPFGPIFNLSIDLGRTTSRSADVPRFPADAGRQHSTLIALALPPLGISYTRVSTLAVEPRSPAVVGTGDRQEEQVLLRSVVTSALGVTVLQSLNDYVTVGATLKVVRGAAERILGAAGSWDEGFDRAERLERGGSTKADADVGAMFAWRAVRAGLVVRNVTEPTFDGGASDGLTVRRHARVGVAWGDRWPGQARTIVAADADTTRVLAVDGERRDVAVGAERWVGTRMSVRAGVRASTVGDARPVVSGGASYAIRAGTFVDGFVGAGDRSTRSWGVGVRVAF
jgi:hypothetical protein